jgi:uracil-DNA glycosylase family 4
MNKLDKQKALAKIAKEIENCKICKIGKVGKAVPGEGDANADIVFLGEAPGKKEAETGRPFIGRAGKLLRQMLLEVGIKDEDVYITSPVKYLPEYVTPTDEDIAHGRTHLFKQLKVIEPKIVVLMGNTAVKAVLQEKLHIAKVHGTIVKRDGLTYLITYHPAAPLYAPKLREELKKDFSNLKKLTKK